MKTKTGVPRFRFKQDDDSHWYLVPESRSQEFDDVLECGHDDDFEEFNSLFAGMAIGSSPVMFTFEHPKRDE